ncbi:MAG: DUF983 domain-containing protein [Flavobacteriales bacterium]|nr:DUF983 domain-containing protein [Bacteroidota bacterium]MCB9241756.1 DUF983 domain-containing protein [Flavobacteriales bacterium]
MTGFQAFLKGKCPQCHRGNIFTHSLFSSKFREVHTHCSHCKVKYESEPGFFWGAMYFSYALVVATVVFVSVIIYSTQEEPPLMSTSAIVIGTSLLLTPLHLRLSRLLMVYLASPYRKFRQELSEDQKD